MKAAWFAAWVLSFCFAAVGWATSETTPAVVSLGHDTYSVTRAAASGFTRDTDRLRELALDAAKAHCAKLNRELKIVSVTAQRPTIPLTGFAHATVVFKALAPNDPALQVSTRQIDAKTSSSGVNAGTPTESAVPPTPVDPLYFGLLKLDELHKRGLLTDEEFQAQRKALVEKMK